MPVFAGKTAVVTGASRGIGRAIALALATEGATVVCAARTLEGPLERGSITETASKIRAQGGSALAVACDVTKRDQVDALVRRTLDETGSIDLLVNNAGIYTRGIVASLASEAWEESLATNLTGPFLLCRYTLPGMIARRRGNILNVTSGAAQRYDRQHVAYSVAKAGLDRFTANLAEEVRGAGVVVNALDPGLVKTEMNAFYSGGDPPEAVVPAALWLLGREDTTFTGRVVSRKEFGTTWPQDGQR